MSISSVASKKSPSSSSPSSVSEEEPKGIRKITRWLRKNLLLLLTVGAVLLAVAIGLPLREANLSPEVKRAIGFPGEIMMNLLKATVVPLVVTSLIANLAQLDAKQMGKIGGLAIVYYLATTILAVILAIAVVLAIHPGKPSEYGSATATLLARHRNASSVNTLLDLVRNMFPENVLQATTWQAQSDEEGRLEYSRGTNVLGVITFSIFVGAVLASLGPDKKKPLVTILAVLDELMMKSVTIIMWYTPVGITFLIIQRILEVNSFWGTLSTLGLYMLTVVLGLVIHSVVTLPLIYFICTRKSPLRFARGMVQALLTAFATASSSATLPFSMQCLEEKLKVDPRIVRFVLPIGATINMDGTALYEAVASIFIAQMHGEFDLTFGRVVVVSLTATLASIGAAAIPSAGIITMMIVLSAIGLPQDDVAIIIAVDWLLDFYTRNLTAVNLTSVFVQLGLGDVLQQKIHGELDRDGWDWQRTMRITCVGFAMAPMIHYFYRFLDSRRFVGGKNAVTLKKVATDTAFNPMFSFTFLNTAAVLEGKTVALSLKEYREKMLFVIRTDLSVWPCAQLLNFYLLPASLRVMYVNVVALFYCCFMSFVKHNEI